ncbi:DUF397 domain-containing protein [Streptomyces sp. NPDC006654]|uniref:DUF397 domain-containing protein n=1 Tax=unclassified Streptomyces TaxID=2593676 RepID=UPI0033C0711E
MARKSPSSPIRQLDGAYCLEVAPGHPTLTPVRDSKNPRGPKLVFRSAAWSAFVADVKGNAR